MSTEGWWKRSGKKPPSRTWRLPWGMPGGMPGWKTQAHSRGTLTDSPKVPSKGRGDTPRLPRTQPRRRLRRGGSQTWGEAWVGAGPTGSFLTCKGEEYNKSNNSDGKTRFVQLWVNSKVQIRFCMGMKIHRKWCRLEYILSPLTKISKIYYSLSLCQNIIFFKGTMKILPFTCHDLIIDSFGLSSRWVR